MSVEGISKSLRRSTQPAWRSRLARAGVLLSISLLQACATVPYPNSRDPLESMNRKVFVFNDTVDETVLRPIATVYRDVLPHWVRLGVGNFFSNFEDLWSGVNNALQLRGRDTADSFGRVTINTVFGLAGLLDIASDMQMERHPANFGLTLGRWGVGAGPFVVLPLLGSSTLRDTAAMSVDLQGDVVRRISNEETRTVLYLIGVVDTRVAYLKASEVVEEAALDKYSFTRDAYLQRRRNLVYDGNPPEEDMELYNYSDAPSKP